MALETIAIGLSGMKIMGRRRKGIICASSSHERRHQSRVDTPAGSHECPKAIVGLGRLKRHCFCVACRMILSVITHLLTEKQELVALPEGRYNHKYTWIKTHIGTLSSNHPRVFRRTTHKVALSKVLCLPDDALPLRSCPLLVLLPISSSLLFPIPLCSAGQPLIYLLVEVGTSCLGTVPLPNPLSDSPSTIINPLLACLTQVLPLTPQPPSSHP
jgi:hypothetical protein